MPVKVRNVALSYLTGAYCATFFYAFGLEHYDPYAHGGSPFLMSYVDLLIFAPLLPIVEIYELVANKLGVSDAFRFDGTLSMFFCDIRRDMCIPP